MDGWVLGWVDGWVLGCELGWVDGCSLGDVERDGCKLGCGEDVGSLV